MEKLVKKSTPIWRKEYWIPTGEEMFICPTDKMKGFSWVKIDVQTRHKVCTAKISKTWKGNSFYKVYVEGDSKYSFIKIISVEKIEDCPKLTVMGDTKQGRSKNLGRKKKLLIILTHDDGVERFTEQGYKMIYNPLAEGKCYCAALDFAISRTEIHCSSKFCEATLLEFRGWMKS